MADPVSDIIGAIAGALTALERMVEAQLRDVGRVLGVGIGTVYAGAQDSILGTLRVVTSAVDALRGAIGAGIGAVQAALGNIAAAAAHLPIDVRDLAGRVGDAVAALPADLAQALGDEVPAVLTGALGWVFENWQTIKDIAAFLAPDFDLSALSRFLDRLTAGEVSTSELFSAGTPSEVKNPIEQFGWFIIYGLSLVTSVIAGGSEPVVEMYRQRAWPDVPIRIVGAPELAALSVRDLIGPGEVDDLLARQGWRRDQFTLMQEMARQTLAPGELIDLYNRNGRNLHNLTVDLKRLGVTEEDSARLAQLADVLPPPTDVIRFAQRDNFIPEFVQLFGMDQEFDTTWQNGQKWFEQVGITKAVALEYWKAHWELPSLEYGYRMFQRVGKDAQGEPRTLPSGKTVNTYITNETLQRLHRAHGIEPYWRHAFANIAFTPITRVDIRRLNKLGILNPDEVAEAYMNIGYSDENAARLSAFTVALNTEDDAEQLKSIRSPIASKALASYVKLYSNQEETAALLKELGFTPIQIRYELAMADHDRANADADAAASAARAGYVSGTYSEDDVRVLLSKQHFRPEATERLLAAWDVARFTRDLSDAEKAQRDLTKSEILAAYSDKVITRDEAGPLLIVTGYDAEEANVLLAVEDAKGAKADTAALVAATHADFVAGKLARGDASGELDKWGVATKRRDALLRSWELERSQREAHIAVSDLKAMFTSGVISDADATEQLTIQGFGDKQIAWYLQAWAGGGATQTTRRRGGG